MRLTDPRPGLYQKFDVRRIHGEDKPGEQFFVLSPTHDPFARAALYEYALACDKAGLHDLAADIRAALRRVAIGQPFYQEEK